MATTRTFNDMLNEYLTYDLLREEMIKRDYVLQRVEKDNGWKGGTLPVPFKAAGATSIKFGGLTGQSDIAEDKYIRGEVTDYKEAWGSLLFNQTDIVQHDGRVKEDSFLRLLPDSIEDFMDYMKQVMSIQLTQGPHFDEGLANGTAGGVLVVSSVDRFAIDQKIRLRDDDTAIADYYVIAIDVNADVANRLASGSITVSATRGGAAADISAYTLAANTKVYHDGVDQTGTTTFTDLKQSLLSAANGGSSTLYGQTKLSYPFLQAVQIDGSGVTKSNILEKIFDGYVKVRAKAKGMANEVLMNFKHLGSIMKLIEVQKGGFKVAPDSEKASEYGWLEIVITSITGTRLKFVGIQEFPEDIIAFMDWRSVKFHTNEMFRKNISPDGNQFYVVRGTSGYQYICDIALYGELILNKPGHCGIMYDIPNYAV